MTRPSPVATKSQRLHLTAQIAGLFDDSLPSGRVPAAWLQPGAHAVVMLDRAGWHTSSTLEIPRNITLMALPPRSPELNPVENVWQFMRDNWLSNRIFQSYDDILDHRCQL